MAVACPEGKSSTKRANSKPVMVATQGLGKHAVCATEWKTGWSRCTGASSIVKASLVDTSKCTQQTVKVKCVHGDVITYPSATVYLKINVWERKITVALVPDVPVDVVLAWSDHSPTAEVKNLVTTSTQRSRQLQEMTQGEVEATPSNSVQLTEDLDVEGEGKDDPLPARGLVSEYPDRQEGGKCPAGNGLYTPNTPSKDSYAHAFAVLQATLKQLRDWQQTDPTLQKGELASSCAEEKPDGATFFYGGVLIQRSHQL